MTNFNTFLYQNSASIALFAIAFGVVIYFWKLFALARYLVFGDVKIRYRVRFRYDGTKFKANFHYGTYRFYWLAWFIKTVLQVNETNTYVKYWVSRDVYERN